MTAENLHIKGVSQLLLPTSAESISQSIQALEEAARRKPEDASILNDLSAAYFLRAQKLDDPSELLLAFEAVNKAVDANGNLAEARFNRALVLDALFLIDAAREAWKDYLQFGERSAWDKEAQRRLMALVGISLPDLWTQCLPTLREAALRSDRAKVRTLVALSPQAAREYAMEDLLGEWGHLIAQGRLEDARAPLRIARVIGEALHRNTGEPSVVVAVDTIERTSGQPALLALAAGHQFLRDGMRSFRVLATSEAAADFESALENLGVGGSPSVLWARGGIARVKAYGSLFTEAEEIFLEILPEAQRHNYRSLLGWTYWGLGWLKTRQGHLTEALHFFQEAALVYRAIRETENGAAVESFLAENLTLLGQDKAAWWHRQQALAALSQFPVSWRRHVLLLDSGWTASEAGLPKTALTFRNEGLQLAERAGDPVRLAEAYLARSRVQAGLGRTTVAWEDLQQAEAFAKKAPEGAPRRKLLADLFMARSEALRRTDPDSAIRKLNAAFAAYRELDLPLNISRTLLERARLYLQVGQATRAESDLQNALSLLEKIGELVGGRDLEISYAETLQGVYDELIRLRLARGQDTREALELLHRAKCLGAGLPCGDLESPLPQDVVAVEYAVLKDRLLIWVRQGSQTEAFERFITAVELEALVEDSLAGIRNKATIVYFEQTLAKLRALLIPATVEALRPGRMIYFIPDRCLHRVPFAALWNPEKKRFLIEDQAFAVAPVYKRPSNSPRPPAGHLSVLWVGDPAFDRELFKHLSALPFARTEVEAGSKFFRSSLTLLGSEATPERLFREIGRFQMLVFAGHAFSHASQPSQSHLVLAPSPGPPDSGLFLAEALESKRLENLQLVVLSACSSVGPPSSRSAGLTGMADAFLKSGVRTVVGSLWSVNDRRTADFLAIFYRQLAAGVPVAEALRQAQVRAIRDEALGAPSVWSAFEVVEAVPANQGPSARAFKHER